MSQRLLALGVASRCLSLRHLALHLNGFLQCIDHLRQSPGRTFAILRREPLLLFELFEFAIDCVVDTLYEGTGF